MTRDGSDGRRPGHGRAGGEGSLRVMAQDLDTPTLAAQAPQAAPMSNPVSPLLRSAIMAMAGEGPSMRNGSLPDLAQTDVFARLLKERIIFLGTAIDENVANLVCSQLLLLDAEEN